MKYICLIFITILFIICMLFELQMLQQNVYNEKNKYFSFLMKDIKKNYNLYLLKFLFGLSLLFFTEFTNILFLYFFVIMFILLLSSYFSFIHHQEKLPLKYTKRLIRILSLDVIFYIIILLFIVKLNITYMCGILLLYISLNPFILILIISLLTPVEKFIFNYYKGMALEKLNKMNNINIIGITGSFGKTSTKMILESILSVKYKGFYTPNSFNTPNGVVMTINSQNTIFNDYFICEMGARAKGEIKEICDIVKPKYGIITSIGPAHLDTFKNIENICKTKFELAGSLPKDGILILNKDDEDMKKYKLSNKVKVIWIGIKNKADVMAKDIKITNKGTTFKLCFGKDEIEVNTILLGEKNIYNILSSCALAKELGLSLKEIKMGIKNIKPISHRLEIKQVKNTVIIDDSYNSNPVGANNALDVLSLMEGKKIIITPGMVEMGKEEAKLNNEFGKKIAKVCDEIYLIGKERCKPIKEGVLSVNQKAKIYEYNRFMLAYNDIMNTSGNKKCTILIENDLPDLYTEE